MPDVEIDTEILTALATRAPTYRALTMTEITATTYRTYYPRPRARVYLRLYEGKRIVDAVPPGRVVIIDTSHFSYWRVTTSMMAEPTPYLVAASRCPPESEKIAEAHGLVIYQTPTSTMDAMIYQRSKGRLQIAISLLNTAIIMQMRGSTITEEDEARYGRFRKAAALGLNAGTPGEAAAALGKAFAIGESMARGTRNGGG